MTISGNWDRRVSRRTFIGLGGMTVAALTLGANDASARSKGPGFGRLQRDPGGVLDLPKGFQYRIISEEGTNLSNGAPVPGDHDGMAAFPGPEGGTTVLVRNQELTPNEEPRVVPASPTNSYDPTQAGGTTGIVVDNRTRREVRDFVTSSGTQSNCAGGATPWGTWLTCEETLFPGALPHGYVFEVDPGDPENELSKTPILDMGRFAHEAVGVDPATGICYLTEDDPSGNANTNDDDDLLTDIGTSFLYRYIPNNTSQRPGALQEGGRLQVMAVDEAPRADADSFERKDRFAVRWIDIVNPQSAHEEALASDAVRFNRLEGAFFSGGAFWFDDTNGGEDRLGQIFRYFPEPTNRLELFYEGTKAKNMQSPDNITITPWGDLWFAEDGEGFDRVMGVTPKGKIYTFAESRLNDSELCGPTFSPDGKTFFVNIQTPGITFAIWGPFPSPSASGQRAMSYASPPEALAPLVSDDLAAAASLHGMSPLEAAAFDRLGVPLPA